MKTQHILGLGAALVVPALTLTSCSQSPEDKAVESLELLLEVADICQEVKDGKMEEDEAAEKVAEISEEINTLTKELQEAEKDPQVKEELKKLMEDEKVKSLIANLQKKMPVVMEVMSTSKNEKLKEALRSAGKGL